MHVGTTDDSRRADGLTGRDGLKEARLVQHERLRTQNVYRVDPAGMMALRKYLDAMWSRALGHFKSAAEASYHRARKERP